jgi:hypothetical protein
MYVYISVMKARFHDNLDESYDRNLSVLETFNLTALIVVEVCDSEVSTAVTIEVGRTPNEAVCGFL